MIRRNPVSYTHLVPREMDHRVVGKPSGHVTRRVVVLLLHQDLLHRVHAASMENQVPEDVVKERFDRLLNEVQSISAKIMQLSAAKAYDVVSEFQSTASILSRNFCRASASSAVSPQVNAIQRPNMALPSTTCSIYRLSLIHISQSAHLLSIHGKHMDYYITSK